MTTKSNTFGGILADVLILVRRNSNSKSCPVFVKVFLKSRQTKQVKQNKPAAQDSEA